MLARVFSSRKEEKDLHALMACLCVLFEDLRIELGGQIAKDLRELDVTSKDARKFYFLRRSIATLFEFGTVIEELDSLPTFQPVKAGFHFEVQRQWLSAVTYFKKYDKYIARVRHNVGGHFGKDGARLAIANLLPDVAGCIEVTFSDDSESGGAKLFFANEIVGTGALQHVRGSDITAKSRRLIRHALVGYRKATRAFDCIAVGYLWDRFGK
jgi:hypothetical protein